MAKEKFLLAYSGGLDTSIIIPWLLEHYDCEVVAYCGEVGVGVDNDYLEKKALKCGAIKCIVENIEEEFVSDYVFPTLKANAVYEGKYLLGTSMARPLIAKHFVDVAKQEGCTTIVHGCTGKGNDQVRFELSIKALAPDMKILAPWRIWDIKSRDEEIDYAAAHGIEVPVTKENNYSMDENLWHLSHEGMDLEDPANEPDLDKILELMVSPEKAPDTPTYVTFKFENGIPVEVDGQKLSPAELLKYCNKVAGANGVGIADIVENRLVGMKSRGVYETPGGTLLFAAHRELELLTIERDTLHYKDLVAQKFAELVYYGQWFHPLREALSAFVDDTQKTVTGEVKMKLYKGNCTPAGTKSPYSLYDPEIATFEADEVYNQADAGGFINCFGLPMKVNAAMKKKNGLR